MAKIRDLRGGGWAWVYKSLLFDPRLDSYHKTIYSILSARAGEDQATTRGVSVAKIAKAVPCSETTARGRLGDLDEYKYIEIVRERYRTDDGKIRHKVNEYLLLDNPTRDGYPSEEGTSPDDVPTSPDDVPTSPDDDPTSPDDDDLDPIIESFSLPTHRGDPRLLHPALWLYRDTMNRTVANDDTVRDKIVATVGEALLDQVAWAEHCRMWKYELNWNPGNIAGLLDSYEAWRRSQFTPSTAITNKRRGSKNQSAAPEPEATEATIRAAKQLKEQLKK